MKIDLDKIDYYYLTIPENVERITHIKSEFRNYNITEVNPVPYKDIIGNYNERVKKLKSGVTGYLRIIDFVMQKYNNGVFKPFIIIEDDVKKYRDIPNQVEIPSDSDICYIGLSRWGMTNLNAHGVENSVCYQDVNSEIIKVQNMLSTHGIIVTSLRGLTTLQKCLIEDYYLNRGWDMCLAQIQPFINAYALKQPLVYQYKKVGGQEKQTKIDYTQLNNKTLPNQWINNTNLSNISIYKPVEKIMKVGVFGTCRVQDWKFDNLTLDNSQFPLTYRNSKFIINVRPLGYTTSTTDILQNLELAKHNLYDIKDEFIYRNIFLKHNNRSKEAIFDTDYDVLVLEICSIKKLLHHKSGFIFPYHCAEINGREIFFNDLPKSEYSLNDEKFEETIKKIRMIRDLIKCKIILVPPITEFLVKITQSKDEYDKKIDHTIAHRADIIDRLNNAKDDKDIYFINWNDIIKENGIDKMVEDQFHFTEYGRRYIAEYIYNFIQKNF